MPSLTTRQPGLKQPTRPAVPSDPLERYVPLGLKLLVYLILIIYLIQAAEAFYEYVPGTHWPFLLTAIRNGIFLFIHEGGHFLFSFFGHTLYILGGSFWQIMFPAISFAIAVRNRSHFIAPFALFWVGTNMMDVSLYMRDAPVRMLPLLGGHKGWHDWWNLFSQWGMLDSAGTWADVFYFVGLFVSIAAIGGGIYLSFQRFLHPLPYTIPDDDNSVVRPRRIQGLPVAVPGTPAPHGESEQNETNSFEGL
jgi:hypothetical protein